MFLVGSKRQGGGGSFAFGVITPGADREAAIEEATRLANHYPGTYEFVVVEGTVTHNVSVPRPEPVPKVKKDVIVFD